MGACLLGSVQARYCAKPKDIRGLRLQVFEANRRAPEFRACSSRVGVRLSAAAVGQLLRAQTPVKQRLERVCLQHPTKAVGEVPILTEFADDVLHLCFEGAVKRLAERRNDLVRFLLGLLSFCLRGRRLICHCER